MSVLDALGREFDAAQRDDLEVRRVRVSRDAIPGSAVVVPLTPERLRVLVPLRETLAGVVTDLEAFERWREIIIHPQDLERLLCECSDMAGLAVHPSHVLGLPLVI